MVDVVFLGLLGSGVLVFGITFVIGVSRLRVWNQLKQSSVGPVNGSGLVELEGTATVHETTVDPPKGDGKALIYEYKREKRNNNHDPEDNTAEWRTTTDEAESTPFAVESEHGDVLVEPDNADLFLEGSTSYNHQSDTRVTMSRLDVDDPVYVAGTAVQASESTLNADSQQYTVTGGDALSGGILGGLTGSPFVISDSGESKAEGRIMQSALKYLLIAIGALVITVVGVLVRFGIIG